MGLDLSKIQSHSSLAGLLDLGTVDAATLTVSGLTISAQSQSGTYNIPLNFHRSDVISLINVTMTGGSSGIANFTFPLYGILNLYDFAGGYNAYFIVQSATSGRNIQLQFGNQLSNASVTVPTLTINVHAHLYAYPF